MQSARLPLWKAAVCVLLAGVLAQLVGAFVADFARTWIGLHGAVTPGANPSPWVVVPAMIASATTLIAAALFTTAMGVLPAQKALGLRRAAPTSFLAAAVGTIMLGPLADVSMRAMQELAPGLSLGVVPMLHDLVQEIPFYIAWPAFALLPGISEELLFRGVLQGSAPLGISGILISGVGFSLFHLDPQHIAGVLPLGLFLAWVASRCGTWVTIVVHVANNTASIAAVHSDTFNVGVGTEAPLPWPWLPVSLALVAVSAWVIVRNTPRASARGSAGPSIPYSDANESWCRLPPC